ncbi:SH3 domain-containing protein [Hazenella coriacea]|uniref:SH3 domain-containing protein n=1 Tax=Hazenella coriacea TaxID=1179467 RepID=A0A4V2UUQ3_9BACL|nr:SH3 domain-containing protein [Hazenella coriacea]TCS92347.1 SH3 domain-containing protein [Hazenella coriacea]
MLKWCRFIVVTFMLAVLTSYALPGSIEAATTPDYKIEVNKKTNKLYLYKNGSVSKVYPVATGRTTALTPEGTFPMVVKISKPGWKHIPGGLPENPLGERWNGISVNGDNGRMYGIHGTNNPKSIGSSASSGCIRMHNNDVIQLYNTIYEGTPVWIHSGTSNNKWRGDSRVGLKPASGTVQVNGTNVNARTGPSTGAFVVQSLNKGTVLTRTGVSGDWVQVKLPNGKIAFIHKNYVVDSSKPTPTPPTSNFTPSSGQVQVTVNIANIRVSPSLSSTVLTKAKKGSIFTLKAYNKEWFQVQLPNGKIAYLHSTVAKKTAPANSGFSKASGQVVISVNVANVRTNPSLTSPVMTKAKRGTKFTLIGVSKEWYQIKLANGKIAYLHNSVAKR